VTVRLLKSRSGDAVGECASRLVEVAPLVFRFIRAEMRTQMPGLTMPQFRSLAFIYRRGGCSLSEVAEHLGVTLPTASSLVDRLVRSGLVTRDPSARSRRQVALQLTREGVARFERAKDAARRRTEQRLSALPERALQALRLGLEILAAAFSEKGGEPSVDVPTRSTR